MTTNRQNSRKNNFSFDFRARKKPISKVIKGLPVDYKDVDVLLSYVSDRAKISSSYRTGNAAKDHRSLTKAIKRARHMALLPISHEHDTVRSSVAESSEETKAKSPEEATTESSEETKAKSPEEATTESSEETKAKSPEEATIESSEKKSDDS